MKTKVYDSIDELTNINFSKEKFSIIISKLSAKDERYHSTIEYNDNTIIETHSRIYELIPHIKSEFDKYNSSKRINIPCLGWNKIHLAFRSQKEVKEVYSRAKRLNATKYVAQFIPFDLYEIDAIKEDLSKE